MYVLIMYYVHTVCMNLRIYILCKWYISIYVQYVCMYVCMYVTWKTIVIVIIPEA